MTAPTEMAVLTLRGFPGPVAWRRVLRLGFILCACGLFALWLAGLKRGVLSAGWVDDPMFWIWDLGCAFCGALLGVVLSPDRITNAGAVRRLAATLEQGSSDTSRRPLAEIGPADVARLIRAINARFARDAEQLAEHLTAQAEFAHDMRGPMARIGLRCERLADEELRGKMERDLADLNSLVESSLAFARTLHGAREPVRRIDVDGLIDSLVGDYAEAGHSIQVAGRIGQPVTSSPHSLRRALTNLIDNALRHGGSAHVNVRIEAQRIVLAVQDDGPGVEAAELRNIFMPWYRGVDSPTRSSGCGLGLAIARRLAMSLQGELHAGNGVGGGFEAVLTLPLNCA